MPKVIKSSVKPMTSGLQELSGLNNEQTPANTKTTASTTAASAINEEEMQHWKNRCSLIEQQHRVSVQRLSELQAYIEQLRRDAQQAAVKVANSSSAPTPAAPAVSATVPLQTNFSSVHMSSIRDAWSNGNIATPTCQSDTLSFTQPPSSSCCADPSPIGVTSLPAQQAVGKQYGDTGPAPQHVIVPDALPNLGVAVTPTSGVDRATALQKLREDLDEECARFVSESERWKKFLQTQRCAIGSEAVGVSGLR
ncbi:unnamed protein product [Trypanosoma congolense IL3000]|uniref:WGS project CAEQ00000000 data, annotated contig 2026 n=1 Tax=Trypanosoma congolense (strain IL3000) TaxID=1068625 RepID=F9WAX2_TRYCI|nr:unnamed protein product [Trypanosoma congolense IL3000]